MPQQQRSVQFEPTAKHGPISGPVNGGLTALALTVIIWAGNRTGNELPVWLPLALAAAGSAVAAVVTMAKRSSLPNLWFRVFCWMGGGAWSYFALTLGVDYFLLMLLGLVAGTGLAGMMSTIFRPPTDVVTGEIVPVTTLTPTPLGNLDKWAYGLEILISRQLGLKDNERVTVTRTNNWPNQAGATFQIDFSAGSSKGLRDIQDISVRLQQAMRLPDGCTATAKRSGRQGSCLLDVMFFNDMETTYPFPEAWTPRSGKDQFSLGLYGDKTHAMTRLYQDSMIITGVRGGGKTVLLWSITAWMMQCVDVVIWHADLNGGSISTQWMYLKAIGEIDEYPIDWVAHNASEMLLMADAAEAIAKKRKTAYAHLLVSEDEDKLQITREIPMLLIIVDEGGEAFGDDADKIAAAAAKKFRAVQRIGRAMCVNIIFSSQRATADYIPAAMKKAATVKVSMPVDDDAELAYLFDWKGHLSSDDLMYPGCAFVKLGTGALIRMVKTFYTKPSTIKSCVRATHTWRPKLDQISADEAGDIYHERWQRADTVAWMASLAGDAKAISEYSSSSQSASATAVLEAAEIGDLPGMEDTLKMLQMIEAEQNIIDGLDPGGQPREDGDPAKPVDGGVHDRDAIVKRRVFEMNSDELQRRAEEILQAPWNDDDGEEGEPVQPAGPMALPAGPGNNSAPKPPETGNNGAEKVSGVEWTYAFVARNGAVPTKTKAIVDAAITEGIIERRNTPNEWIAQLVTEGRLYSPKYAHYVIDKYRPAG